MPRRFRWLGCCQFSPPLDSWYNSNGVVTGEPDRPGSGEHQYSWPSVPGTATMKARSCNNTLPGSPSSQNPPACAAGRGLRTVAATRTVADPAKQCNRTSTSRGAPSPTTRPRASTTERSGPLHQCQRVEGHRAGVAPCVFPTTLARNVVTRVPTAISRKRCALPVCSVTWPRGSISGLAERAANDGQGVCGLDRSQPTGERTYLRRTTSRNQESPADRSVGHRSARASGQRRGSTPAIEACAGRRTNLRSGTPIVTGSAADPGRPSS